MIWSSHIRNYIETEHVLTCGVEEYRRDEVAARFRCWATTTACRNLSVALHLANVKRLRDITEITPAHIRRVRGIDQMTVRLAWHIVKKIHGFERAERWRESDIGQPRLEPIDRDGQPTQITDKGGRFHDRQRRLITHARRHQPGRSALALAG